MLAVIAAAVGWCYAIGQNVVGGLPRARHDNSRGEIVARALPSGMVAGATQVHGEAARRGTSTLFAPTSNGDDCARNTAQNQCDGRCRRSQAKDMADELATEAMDVVVSALDKNPGAYEVRVAGPCSAIAFRLRSGWAGGVQTDQGADGQEVRRQLARDYWRGVRLRSDPSA